MAKYKKKNTDNRVIDIKDKFKKANTAWSASRKAANSDVLFFSGEQYDKEALQLAQQMGKGDYVTFNFLQPMIQSVHNGIRDSNPTITVIPTDEAASETTAKIMNGMFRRIERVSNAKTAYMTASGINGALVPGFGFIKIETDYVSNSSFDQDIYIREVKDPFKILPDPNSKMSDFGDANFWFEFEDLTKEDFEKKYPDSELAQANDWNLIGESMRDQGGSWIKGNKVRLARYWYRVERKRTLAMFEDGTSGFLDEFGLNAKGEPTDSDDVLYEVPQIELTSEEQDEIVASAIEEAGDPNVLIEVPQTRNAEIVNSRSVDDGVVHWCLTNGYEVLEEDDWHNNDFPFVAIVGQDQIVEGVRDIHGLIRFAKPGQRLYNYYNTQIVRRISSTNLVPWLLDERSVTQKQLEAFASSHYDPKAALVYKSVDQLGNPITPPQRGDTTSPDISSFLAASQKALEETKMGIGMYDGNLGKDIGERQSGKAIQTLAERGDKANLHFSLNLVSGLRDLGNKIIRLMPLVYDTARVVTIINPDNSTELVRINELFHTKSGEQMAYMLGDGTYGVEVDLGPSYKTKKTQELNEMMELVEAAPQLFGSIADLVVKSTDWSVKDELYERIMNKIGHDEPWLITPPAIEDAPPQFQAFASSMLREIADLKTTNQELVQENQKLSFTNTANIVNNQAKARLQEEKSFTDLQVERIRLVGIYMENQSKENREQLKLEIASIQAKQKHAVETIKLIDRANKEDKDREFQYHQFEKQMAQGEVQ